MVRRTIVEIDGELCDGCGKCVTACAEGALEIIDGRARVVRDSLCDGLGACIGDCPQGALRVIEREADEFDEEAVKERMGGGPDPCECPSAIPVRISRTPPVRDGTPMRPEPSMLSRWPVQLRLVPPDRSFFDGEDVVLLADCCALACGNLQNDFVRGKVVVMLCPKFDDTGAIRSKLASVFTATKPRSLTLVKMGVPCCGMTRLVDDALAAAGANLVYETVTVGVPR